MTVKETFGSFESFKNRVKIWDYNEIKNTWSAHSPGPWVARFTSAQSASKEFCNLSREVDGYLAIFFEREPGEKSWKIVEWQNIEPEDTEKVKQWLEARNRAKSL